MSVRDWWASAPRVYPAIHFGPWRADWHAYEAFCAERDVTTVPATPTIVGAFIVSVASSDDVPVRARFVGVSGDGFIGFEVQVALNR
jgi:hypothetical protein